MEDLLVKDVIIDGKSSEKAKKTQSDEPERLSDVLVMQLMICMILLLIYVLLNTFFTDISEDFLAFFREKSEITVLKEVIERAIWNLR